tara:strand:- start:78 stop:179 length:102 start_codon:yes stop_codon:yes gene_type:complete
MLALLATDGIVAELGVALGYFSVIGKIERQLKA